MRDAPPVNVRQPELTAVCGIAVTMDRLALTATAALFVASCAPAPYAPYPPYGPFPPGQPHSPYPPHQIGCPIAGSSDWAAWVNAMPGPNARPTLIVSGKVTVPTGGYRFVWRDMRVMESHPVQVVADLEVIPPSGGATQAVVTHDVRGEWPMSPPVGSVTIRCGDRTLAAISPVETAH